MMKRLLSVLSLAVILLTTGCGGNNGQESLPRSEVSAEWSAAAESFYSDAMSVTAPDNAQPYSIMAVEHGKWNGRQLLPAEWVDTMTSKLVESSPTNAFTKSSDSEVLNDSGNDHSQGYGYYVWQGKHGTYRMEGMLGNLVFVNPEKEVVLVFTSRSNMDQKYIDLIWKNFAHLFN